MNTFVIAAEELTTREYSVIASTEEEARDKVRQLHVGQAVRGIELNHENIDTQLIRTYVVGENTESITTDDGDFARCPACGDPIDSCRGHGEISDPYGHETLRLHDNGIHNVCNPSGCDEINPENRNAIG